MRRKIKMGIPIIITPRELKKCKRLLAKEQDIICCDEKSWLKFNLIGYHFPSIVKAKLIKGFKT
jgi:hypothetical protein